MKDDDVTITKLEYARLRDKADAYDRCRTSCMNCVAKRYAEMLEEKVEEQKRKRVEHANELNRQILVLTDERKDLSARLKDCLDFIASIRGPLYDHDMHDLEIMADSLVSKYSGDGGVVS